MPKRLPYELVIIAALALGSCGGPKLSQNQREEVSDIAEAEALDAIPGSSKIQELEERIAALEEKLNM
jgi:polyhydroxyalkanoate synthesis regulator phasin